MLEKYLRDLYIYIIFTGTHTYLLKPIKNHQSHCVSLKLSKPRSHIRDLPYLTVYLAFVEYKFLSTFWNKITIAKLKTALTQLLKDRPIDFTKPYKEVKLCFSHKLFYYMCNS